MKAHENKPISWRRRIADHPFSSRITGDRLQAKALRGSSWTLLGYGGQQLLRLGSNLLLTRLLFPEAFGLMLLANVFLTGLHMFSDLGIHTSIIQNKKGNEANFLHTAWTISIARGFAMWIIACLIAYPVSLIYKEPSLLPLLCVLGSTTAIRGFASTAYATSQKKLSLGRLNILEFVTQIIAIGTTVAWAWVYPSIWALAAGSIISSVVSVWLSFKLLPSHKHRVRFDPSTVSELIRFGKWIFLSTIVTFLANQGDRIILSGFMSMRDFGLYATAINWAMLPWMINMKLSNRVLLAVYSEHQDSSAVQMRSRISKIRWMLCMLLLPVAMICIVYGTEIIEYLYDNRYHGAGWMLQILAVGFGLMVATSIGPFHLSKGDSRMNLLLVSVKAGIAMGAMGIGGMLAGSIGVIVGLSASSLLYYPYQALQYQRSGVWLWKQDILFIGAILAAICLALTRSY